MITQLCGWLGLGGGGGGFRSSAEWGMVMMCFVDAGEKVGVWFLVPCQGQVSA